MTDETEHSPECPTCGVIRMRHYVHIPSTSWTDTCACTDQHPCVGHQARPEDAPDRPSETVMLERAEARRARDEQRHQEYIERFRRARAEQAACAGIPTAVLESGALGRALGMATFYVERQPQPLVVQGVDVCARLRSALRALGKLP